MMQLDFKNNLFVLECGYEHNEIVARAGFAWNRKELCWVTPFADTVLKVKSRSDCTHTTEVEKAITAFYERVKASHNITPKGQYVEMRQFPFQLAALEYMDRDSCLIADEMGIGKTVEAISFCNKVNAQNVLIICPASLQDNWKDEYTKWREAPYLMPRVVSYERFAKEKANIVSTIKWDVLICDEAHYMKNNKAMRTLAVLGGRQIDKKKKIFKMHYPVPAKYRLFLSGTPILNRPIELFPLLHYLLPFGFPDKMRYARRYCNAKHNGFGWDMNGASNLDELQTKLRGTIMLRRLKKDVLPQLPEKFRQVIEIEPDKDTLTVLNRESNIFDDDYEVIVKKLLETGKLEFEKASKVRRDLGVAKVPMVVDHVESLLENTNKVVVFAYHLEVIAKLEEAFVGRCVVVTGNTPVAKRQGLVMRFQNKPEVQVFIGNIQAAGVGFTLTASSTVVFAELDYVPGRITQAEDRTHRIGQKVNVLIQHLVVKGSLDATMAKRMVEKQIVMDKALDFKLSKEMEEALR